MIVQTSLEQKLINNHVLITKRQILIEKYTKPNYTEQIEGLNRKLCRKLCIWTDNEGFYHRINNLPAAIVIDRDRTTFNFYIKGKVTHQITYDNFGNETSAFTKQELEFNCDKLGLIIEPLKLQM